MDISFIIPAYNEEKNIGRCLKSIECAMKNQQKSYEVIVCDHSSADSTSSIAMESGAILVTIPRGGNVSLVRNKGAAIAQGKIYIFLDADIELTKEWAAGLTDALLLLQKSPLQITGSLCLPPQENNYLVNHWFNHTTQKNSGYLGTAHLITTKDCFNQLKGFNEFLITGEDYDFCTRCKDLGGHITLRPELTVYHHDYPKRAIDFIARESWHGEGDFQSIRNIYRSKIAVLTLVFVLLHFLLITSIIIQKFTLMAFVIIFCFIFGSTFLKFKSKNFIHIIQSTPIMYLYFLGRSLSIFRVFKKSWRS